MGRMCWRLEDDSRGSRRNGLFLAVQPRDKPDKETIGCERVYNDETPNVAAAVIRLPQC